MSSADLQMQNPCISFLQILCENCKVRKCWVFLKISAIHRAIVSRTSIWYGGLMLITFCNYVRTLVKDILINRKFSMQEANFRPIVPTAAIWYGGPMLTRCCIYVESMVKLRNAKLDQDILKNERVFYTRVYSSIRPLPTYRLPAIESRTCDKFQEYSIKTKRLVHIVTNRQTGGWTKKRRT